MQAHKLKGSLQDLPTSAIMIGGLVITVGMVVLVLVGMNGSTTNYAANQIISKGVTAMGTYGDWFGTIVIVIIAVVILGLIGGFYLLKGGRGGRA
jgi:uncharacterized protein involved in cysteine biosynthesis